MNKFEIALASAAFALAVAGSEAARAQAGTTATAACQDAVPNHVTTPFGPSAASCSTSGIILPGVDPEYIFGSYTSFATGSAGPLGGGAAIGVTWAQSKSSGISYGPFATIQLESFDTFPAPAAPNFEVEFGVSRVFSLNKPVGGSAEAQFLFTLVLTNRVTSVFDACTLDDSGKCEVVVPTTPGDTLNLYWGVTNTVVVSGTAGGTSGSAFDPATFDILPLELFDAAGNPIYDAVVRGDSGFLYPVATAPVPEPETWALLAAGLALLGGRLKRRRH